MCMYSVTMDRLGGTVHAPINKMTAGETGMWWGGGQGREGDDRAYEYDSKRSTTHVSE